MDKRAQISCFHPSREIVYHSDTCIIYLTVRETENFTEYPTHAQTVVPRPFFPHPQKNGLGTRLDSYFCHLAQKAQITLFLPLLPPGAKNANPMIHTLPHLPLGPKSANPMIHTFFATFAAWRKKRKSHDSYFATFAAWRKKRKSYFFCHFCHLAQKAQIP